MNWQIVSEKMMEGMVVCDIQGSIRYANPSMEILTGYTRESLLTKNIWSLVPREDFSYESQACEQGILDEPVRRRSELKRHDGVVVPVEVCLSIDKSGAEEDLVFFFADISLLAEMEKRLRQSQSMEALGILAGGIAHDFNNILSAMLGYCDLTIATAEGNTHTLKYASQMKQSARRAKDLVSQILCMSRDIEKERCEISIGLIIKEVVQLLRSSLPSSVRMVVQIDPKCGLVMADPVQVHQLMMNLCVNAYQAMEHQTGTIEIGLREVNLDTEEESGPASGEYVLLTVADTGRGMDTETRTKIFEPWFTTREDGTGLGLANVKGIMKLLKGKIEVESQLGKGSVFSLYFPVCSGRKTLPEPSKAQPVTGKDYMEHILFVDDEEPIVSLMRILLAKLGYDVTAFTDSEEALGSFMADPDQYDVLILDYGMPKISGLKMAELALSKRPGMPVVICSGAHEHERTVEEKFGAHVHFARKPMDVHELDVIIRNLFEKSTDLSGNDR